ncbi:uncharacterized protein [Halyomorpha halys]|uniref:uncharacterized protein n=1 Tax=Halyomorpha halys TaxID=286706 RepID=UPI0006D4F644|nr:uncharacterized protein LOC106686564 isoform X2 [Halyomorpha halys]
MTMKANPSLLFLAAFITVASGQDQQPNQPRPNILDWIPRAVDMRSAINQGMSDLQRAVLQRVDIVQNNVQEFLTDEEVRGNITSFADFITTSLNRLRTTIERELPITLGAVRSYL